MRIAYLVNQYPKVSHTFIRREIAALERQGIQVERIAIRGWDAMVADLEDEAERDKTRYVLRSGLMALLVYSFFWILQHPFRAMRGIHQALAFSRVADRSWPLHLVYLMEACRIVSWLDAAEVSHMHAHFGTNSAEVAALVHVLGGPPFSFTVHGPEEFDKPQRLHLSRKISLSAFVVAISSYGRSQLLRWAPHQDWPRIRVAHCGLESGFFRNATDLDTVEAPRLVCVGRICEQKGQLLLVEAARRLIAEGRSLELVLAGDGEMRPEVESAIAAAGLSQQIRITGWISSAQVKDEMLAARALVLPSFAEGLPVVIMEAMALGRPVISTYIAGIPELVRPGQEGWLVPAGDVDSLVHAMRDCLDTPSERLAYMGLRGWHRVHERHHVDTEAAKLKNWFANGLGTR